MEPYYIHPKAYLLDDLVHSKVAMSWKKREEYELVDGMEFIKKRVRVDSVTKFEKFLNDVATYLTFTLHEKTNVLIIRRKLRNLTDVYRHFKMFIFMKDGVQYNPYRNLVKIGPKYWKNIAQETELQAYFRIYGFRLYEKCYHLIEKDNIEQFYSYIDEDVHMTIPVGIDLKDSNVFSYLKHRKRGPYIKVADRNKRYRNSVWSEEKFGRYFFTNGWDPNVELGFMLKLVTCVDERIIEDEVSYANMITYLVRDYDDPNDPEVTKEGIREKIRSIAYVYNMFKRFAFKIVGVEYNFFHFEARVNDDYWEKPRKEPQYMGFFRNRGFTLYQQCFHIFDAMELHRLANGDFESIDPAIVDGVEVSYEEDVFKSYYQDG